MKHWHVLVLRSIAWGSVLAFESVVGFPWLSMYLAAEWLIGFPAHTSIIVLALMSPLVAAGYALPLTAAVGALFILWQVRLRTKQHSWQRWVTIAVIVVAIGAGGGVTFTPIALLFTVLSGGIFLLISKKTVLKKPWRINTAHRSFEQ